MLVVLFGFQAQGLDVNKNFRLQGLECWLLARGFEMGVLG